MSCQRCAAEVGTVSPWVWCCVWAGFRGARAGRLHSLGLQTDGTVWAWGLNGQGQLGTGNAGYRVVPYQVSPMP